jgi:adenylosuccinate synthase
LLDPDGEKLRTGGNEFGSTTGRPRRCGWLDLPALKYAVMLNGADKLIMMKTDVLNSFPEIRICTGYFRNGELMPAFPFELDEDDISPEYLTMPGWDSTLEACTSAQDMPEPLNEYIKFIEDQVGLPVEIVSIGPDRTQTLHR